MRLPLPAGLAYGCDGEIILNPDEEVQARLRLVFNTFHNRRLHDWEHGADLDLAYGAARAHNRGMIEFCSVDPRLLATCYVPLADFDRAAAMAVEAIDAGYAAIERMLS